MTTPNLDPYMEYLEVDPIEVSIVDRGANKRKFEVMKSEDAAAGLVVLEVQKMESAPADEAWSFSDEDLKALGTDAKLAHLVHSLDLATYRYPVAKMADGKMLVNQEALKAAVSELAKPSDLDDEVRGDAYLAATSLLGTNFGVKPEELPKFEVTEAKKNESEETFVSKAFFEKIVADFQAGKLTQEDARKQLENAHSMIVATSAAIVQVAKNAGLDFPVTEEVAKADRKMTARRREEFRNATETLSRLYNEFSEDQMAGEEVKTGEQTVTDASKTEVVDGSEKKEEAAAAADAAPSQADLITQAVAKALEPVAARLAAVEEKLSKTPVAELAPEAKTALETATKSLETINSRLDALEANPAGGSDATHKTEAKKSEGSMWTGLGIK